MCDTKFHVRVPSHDSDRRSFDGLEDRRDTRRNDLLVVGKFRRIVLD